MENLNNYLPKSTPIYEDTVSAAYHTERSEIDSYINEDLSPNDKMHDYKLKSMIFLLKRDFTEEDVDRYMISRGYSCPKLDKEFKSSVLAHRRKLNDERLNSRNVEEPIRIIPDTFTGIIIKMETKVSKNGQISWF